MRTELSFLRATGVRFPALIGAESARGLSGATLASRGTVGYHLCSMTAKERRKRMPEPERSSGVLKERAQEWERKQVNPELLRHPERREEFLTDSGVAVNRIYLPAEGDYLTDLGFPGEFPFTRGVYPTMYRGRFWTMRQYAGFGSADESNRRYRFLLGQGTTGLSVAFDLPTQMGFDSAHVLADGEVGKVGVAIDTLADMERLFDEIPLEKVTTSMTINATAAILLCMYVALAKRQGA